MLESRYTIQKIEERMHIDFQPDTFSLVGYFRGFVQPIGGNEQFMKGKGGENVTARYYTGLSTPVKYGYRITDSGQSYIMLYSIQPTGISGTGHHKEVICGLFS
jgi:hypothetical protein